VTFLGRCADEILSKTSRNRREEMSAKICNTSSAPYYDILRQKGVVFLLLKFLLDFSVVYGIILIKKEGDTYV
jgi:hypothetical protein